MSQESSEKSKKLVKVAPVKRPSVTKENEPSTCLNCFRNCPVVFKCLKCNSGVYCSEKCGSQHYFEHKVLCTAISDLENIDRGKKFVSVRQKCQVKAQSGLIRLGEKPIIKCKLNGQSSKALWDTAENIYELCVR